MKILLPVLFLDQVFYTSMQCYRGCKVIAFFLEKAPASRNTVKINSAASLKSVSLFSSSNRTTDLRKPVACIKEEANAVPIVGEFFF